MPKNLEISVLLDFYGEMLTEKQREVLELYYNEDLSLAEIAQHANITRQGVRDCIKRAEGILLHYEERLGMFRRFREVQDELAQIILCAKEIAFDADKYPDVEGSSILQNTKQIIAIVDKLCE